jgi:hypothetical protein
MWCWRRIEKITSTHRVQNEEGLHIIKEERTVVYKTKGRNAVCIGHIFHRNCPLEHCIEGKIEV